MTTPFPSDVGLLGCHRLPFPSDVGLLGCHNEFPNVVVGDPPLLPRTIHHFTTSSFYASLGREQGVSCEEGFYTSHDVHDFRSYPLGIENDGIGNRAEVQQEVAEDGYATDHEGVEHEPSNLIVNKNIVAEGHHYDADHDGGLRVLADIIYIEGDDPIVNNEYVDDPDEGAEFINHLEQFVEDDDSIDQYVVDNGEFDCLQIEQPPPTIDDLWVGRVFRDKSSLLHTLGE